MTAVFDVLDPVDGAVLDQVPDHSPEDALRALDTAVAKQV